MKELYEKNHDFRYYVDRYCVHRGISKETAFTHSMIRAAAIYYKDKDPGFIKNPVAESVSCDAR